MDRTSSVLDVLTPNLQQTPKTDVPYRYLMRKWGVKRDQFIQAKVGLKDRCATPCETHGARSPLQWPWPQSTDFIKDRCVTGSTRKC